MMLESTKPKPLGIEGIDPSLLVEGRYGTDDTVDLWGPEKTFQFNLDAQATAVKTISDMYPDIIPPEHAKELSGKASIEYVKPERIRQIEADGEHDIDAINTAWGEQVSDEAAAHINKTRTSADSTETAKGLQIKKSVEVIVDSLENLRDIIIERAVSWIDDIHMDVTHLYDALPSVAGRPFAFYVEALQAGIDQLAHYYVNSIYGKSADATGNHHSATALGIDGIKFQEEYCKRLGLKHMIAPAQIPAREFLSQIIFGIAMPAQTMGGLARYIRWGRSSDVGLFRVPRKRKGSSAMPHKDVMGGNPTYEEQTGGYAKHMSGEVSKSVGSCIFDYARDLEGSALDRIMFSTTFKWGDFVIRRLAKRMHELELDTDRSIERVERTYGTVTSQQVMNYLTDGRRVDKPMTRKQADELATRLAGEAYDERRLFVDVCMGDEEITSRFDKETIRYITNPSHYIGQSKEIIVDVFDRYHGKRAFE